MSDGTDEAPTFRSLVVAFTDFLTVAIHTILHERCIYPQTSFLSARKYNFAVRQSRHPKVCEWINDAVAAVETEILKGVVERVAVVIFSAQNSPLERFVFDVSRLPVVPSSDIDVPLVQSMSDGPEQAILPMVDLEEQLRAMMSRLANCGSMLSNLPTGCSFTVVMELKADGEAPVTHPQSWIPAGKPAHQTETNDRTRAPNSKTTPLRSVQAGELTFEAWIERIS